MTVTTNGHDDEKVSNDGEQVRTQEQAESDLFLPWLLRESQEKKFCDSSLVVSVHVCGRENVVTRKRSDLINWTCNFLNDSGSKVYFLMNITSNIK